MSPAAGSKASGPRVAIVGAGVSGLAIAHYLEARAGERGQAPPHVELLEAGPQPGGKIRSDRIDGFLCEWGPNGFLNREPATLELCSALGLDEQLQPATAHFSKRYIFRRGKLRPIAAHPLKFLFSGALPFGAKLRLMREPWVEPPADPPEDESIAAFATRRIGPGAARLLIDPMQSGIYAGDPQRLSVRSCFARVVEVERQYGSLIRGMRKIARERRASGNAGGGDQPTGAPSGHLTSFEDGMQALTSALADRVGERLRCNATIERIERIEGDGRLRVHLESGPPVEADAVVLACPAYVAARLLAGLDPQLAMLVGEIEYAPLAVVCLGFRREDVGHPLDGFGFLAPRGEGLRLLGTLCSSTIFPNRAPADHVLLRAMIGGARDPDALARDDQQIVADTLGELRPVFQLPQQAVLTRVFRHPRAIPQYNLGHGARLERIEQRLSQIPGLLLGGNAFRGIGVNDCVKNAAATADRVLDQLRAAAESPRA